MVPIPPSPAPQGPLHRHSQLRDPLQAPSRTGETPGSSGVPRWDVGVQGLRVVASCRTHHRAGQAGPQPAAG